MDNKNYRGTTDYYIHDNTVERSGANGIAQGDEALYNLGDYVWEDTNKMVSKTQMNKELKE